MKIQCLTISDEHRFNSKARMFPDEHRYNVKQTTGYAKSVFILKAGLSGLTSVFIPFLL